MKGLLLAVCMGSGLPVTSGIDLQHLYCLAMAIGKQDTCTYLSSEGMYQAIYSYKVSNTLLL